MYYVYDDKKELSDLKGHLINNQSVSIFYESSYEASIYESLDTHTLGYFVIESQEYIEKITHTPLDTTFDKVGVIDEEIFFEIMKKPVLVIKDCTNIHPYMLDVLDTSLLKSMIQYKFSGVDGVGNLIDGRATKKRLFGNRCVIFLSDIEKFVEVKNTDADGSDIESELFEGETNGSGEKEVVKKGWFEKSMDNVYAQYEHLKDIYPHHLFIASSTYGSLAPYVVCLYGDVRLTRVCGRNILKQKGYHQRKVIDFAIKHKKTHYLEFDYDVSEKNENGYYEKPEWVRVSLVPTDFRKKKIKEGQYHLTIFIDGSENLVGDSVSNVRINSLKKFFVWKCKGFSLLVR